MPEPARKPVPEAPETEIEKPAAKPFGAFLHEHRNAGLHNELSEALAEVVAAVAEHQKAGSVTVKVEVKPAEGDTTAVVVTDQWAHKVPKPTPPASRFFSDSHGNLSRRDPRQPELPLRDASAE